MFILSIKNYKITEIKLLQYKEISRRFGDLLVFLINNNLVDHTEKYITRDKKTNC